MGTKSTIESLNFFTCQALWGKSFALLYAWKCYRNFLYRLNVFFLQLYQDCCERYSVKTTCDAMYLESFELILSFPFCVVEMVVLVGLPILGGWSLPTSWRLLTKSHRPVLRQLFLTIPLFSPTFTPTSAFNILTPTKGKGIWPYPNLISVKISWNMTILAHTKVSNPCITQQGYEQSDFRLNLAKKTRSIKK